MTCGGEGKGLKYNSLIAMERTITGLHCSGHDKLHPFLTQGIHLQIAVMHALVSVQLSNSVIVTRQNRHSSGIMGCIQKGLHKSLKSVMCVGVCQCAQVHVYTCVYL